MENKDNPIIVGVNDSKMPNPEMAQIEYVMNHQTRNNKEVKKPSVKQSPQLHDANNLTRINNQDIKTINTAKPIYLVDRYTHFHKVRKINNQDN